MANNAKKLSDEAPIILTWVPRVYGASLPDGKNSSLNYLDIVKNHKLKNKEERDIYLVINGPGFEQSQIDDLKRELERIKGVYVIDLHQYDWSEIDKGWKIDGKDISIKNFFENMYDMADEQRTYFAIEIDTFRLIALALLKQFTKHEGGIYIDFDSLNAIDKHIGKDITIPRGILLGSVKFCSDSEKENLNYKSIINVKNLSHHCRNKDLFVAANNDCIVTNSPNIAVKIMSKYKDKMLNQEGMCDEAKKRLSSITKKKIKKELSKIIKGKKLRNQQSKKVSENIESCISNFKENGIRELYNIKNFRYINDLLGDLSLNLAQTSTIATVIDMYWTEGKDLHNKQIEGKLQKVKVDPIQTIESLFSFECNNGNYVTMFRSDMSWMKGEDLYHEQVDNKLDKVKIDQMMVEKLSLK